MEDHSIAMHREPLNIFEHIYFFVHGLGMIVTSDLSPARFIFRCSRSSSSRYQSFPQFGGKWTGHDNAEA